MENKKKIIIIGGVILFLLVAVWLFVRGQSTQKVPEKVAVPTEELIPTVDSSVKVSLETKIAGKEVVLTVANMPKGTDSFEYSLSYETRQQGIQGVIGTVMLDSGKLSYEKDITLGTCSSGKCVYHEVIGNVTLSIKFTGTYGERIFEKEYQLE